MSSMKRTITENPIFPCSFCLSSKVQVQTMSIAIVKWMTFVHTCVFVCFDRIQFSKNVRLKGTMPYVSSQWVFMRSWLMLNFVNSIFFTNSWNENGFVSTECAGTDTNGTYLWIHFPYWMLISLLVFCAVATLDTFTTKRN